MTTEEMIAKKIQEAGSPEEIIAIAKENGGELSAEEAQSVFDRLHGTGELSDDQLEHVAGGMQDDKFWIKINLGKLKINFEIPAI